MFSQIISLLRNNHAILLGVSYLYNLLHLSQIRNSLQRGVHFKGTFLNRVNIKVNGTNNEVIIGEKTIMSNSYIFVSGSNCRLTIEGGGTNINNALIRVIGDNSSITISTKFTINGGTIEACEGKSITIGEDCMFAAGIRVSTTDHHSIIDIDTNERVNKASNIVIGNHVWLGRNVTLHKGATIADDVVIGEGSIVNGLLETEHSVYVGCPARLVKQGITWDRELI